MCDQLGLAADAEYTIRAHFSARRIVDDVIPPSIEVLYHFDQVFSHMSFWLVN
jgi:hypothetical protein